MPFIDVMHTYFRGEKIEAIFFIATTGIALVIFGLTALKAERGGYAWGVAVPALLFGLVLVGVGAGVGLRTDKQVAEIERSFQQSPAALVQKELPRMEKVMRPSARPTTRWACWPRWGCSSTTWAGRTGDAAWGRP